MDDPNGVHISNVGAEVISEIFIYYSNSKLEAECHTPQTRQRRGSSTSTPGSADKQQRKC